MGNENTNPAKRSAQVDKNRFMYLEVKSVRQVGNGQRYVRDFHGICAPNARSPG
jgi:hypothetical protein